jgi:hypothetical protein
MFKLFTELEKQINNLLSEEIDELFRNLIRLIRLGTELDHK